MKLLKKAPLTNKTINEAFKVGQTVTWELCHFDGRGYEQETCKGKVVKVNKRTVDVKTPNGNVYRMDAFIAATTGKWTLK
jgi:hypothetical protein